MIGVTSLSNLNKSPDSLAVPKLIPVPVSNQALPVINNSVLKSIQNTHENHNVRSLTSDNITVNELSGDEIDDEMITVEKKVTEHTTRDHHTLSGKLNLLLQESDGH